MQRTFLLSLSFILTLASLGCHSIRTVYEPRKDYVPHVAEIAAFIEEEMRDKGLPALSIALVDGDEIVWARGFGYADPERDVPATAATVYRVGSVSKLFTDMAIMQLVEKGEIDLDAPVSTYLPSFEPHNRFGDPVTLRQLISHRSGLVREPPVGNYFDPDEPSLEETVASLNETSLVYRPGTRRKYSNAGIAVAGLVLERVARRSFEDYVQEEVLVPMGLESSSFRLDSRLRRLLARGYMWTYDGRIDAAPGFRLGTSPAGNLYASVADLGRMMQVLFAGGRGPERQVISPETLAAMWVPQFEPETERTGYGLGFWVSEFEGHRVVGHNGAVYGFATSVKALPDSRLGVAAVATLDVTNRVVDRIVNHALRSMLAIREGQPPPARESTRAVEPERARALAGTYHDPESRNQVQLVERGGELYLDSGSVVARARRLTAAEGEEYIVDGRLAHGTRITVAPNGRAVTIEGRTYQRVPERLPEPPPVRWRGLIGEYGWDHNTLYILEKNGRLHALIEWFFYYPLDEKSNDLFEFPDYGLYHGESLVFTRDARGIATEVRAANVVFARRPVGLSENQTFKIEPLLEEDELRDIALESDPPEPPAGLREPDLVELRAIDPAIRYDIRYATRNNFMDMVFYPGQRALMQRPAAEAVERVHRRLKPWGYGLLVHDAYRPWYVTKMFWEATPPAQRKFVANPERGSRHNRGCAVDLTLYDLTTLEPVEMVGGYDEFTARSYPYYPGGTTRQRWLRDLLRKSMESENFSVYEWEWWHFDFRDWESYPVLNMTFDEIPAQ